MFEDIEYFQKKLEETIDPIERDKLVQQIKLMEDALEIYRLIRPSGQPES